MSTTTIEREIKLRFASADEARAAILAAGRDAAARAPAPGRFAARHATTSRCDARRCVLRVRMENGKSRLTFKGPVQPGLMKVREELETVVGDGDILLRVLQGARPPRLVPLREVPRGVRARGRHRGDRRDAGRHLRRDRGQRARDRGDGRALGRDEADYIHRLVPRAVPAAPRRVRPHRPDMVFDESDGGS